MTPVESVKSVLSNYATFSGRARRSEYWYFALAMIVLNGVLSLLGDSTPVVTLSGIIALALVIPQLAVGARRLHDTGRSGWWQLISLIPIVGWIVLIVFFAQDGEKGSNKYGPSPKAVAEPTPAAYV